MQISRVVRRLAVGALLVAVVAGFGAHSVAAGPVLSQSIDQVDQVVVVAVPGLRWADVNEVDTPNLFAAVAQGARGALSVKAAEAHTDCGAGMLTLGAGNRAAETPLAERFCRGPAALGGEVSAPVWADAVRANQRDNFGTRPGAMADALAAAGFAVRARGGGASLLAAAGGDGVVPGAHAVTPPRLLVVSDVALYDANVADRRAAVRAVDRRLPRIGPADRVLTIVVGAANAVSDERSLQLALAVGPGFGPGDLVSDSTERAPYVQLIDVAPTVLGALGVEVPDEMVGHPWRVEPASTPASEAVADLTSREEDARQRAAWGGWFVFVLVVSTVGVCLLGCAVLFVPALRRRVVARRLLEGCCLLVAAVPAASWLARPILGWPDNAAVLFLGVALLAAAVALTAMLLARGRSPWTGVAVVAGVSALVLAVDFISGTHLQSESLLGDSSIVAGRFTGAGNTATSVFATSVLIMMGIVGAVLRERGRRVVLVTTVPLLTVALVLVGAPLFGNDFGGLVALAPAAVLFVVLCAGGRRWWALVVALAAGVLAAATVLTVDATLGGGHIGRFAEDLVGGDAGDTLDRKLEASLRSWHSSWYVVMVVVALVVVGLLVTLQRRGGAGGVLKDRDALVAGLLSAALCAVLGGVLNDSGVVVPGAAAVLALPLLLAAYLHVDPERPTVST